MRIAAPLLSLMCALGLNAAASAQDILITNATIVTEDGPQADADLLIQNGKIMRIAKDISAPTGIEVHDGTGQWVTPGLVSPFSSVGLVDISSEDSTNDASAAKAKTSVSERAVDGFNPRSIHIAIARRRGITQAVISPSTSGDSIFAGTGLIANLSGEFNSVQVPAAFVYISLGEIGTERAGGSRSAAMAQLRAALDDAAAYPARYKEPQSGDVLSRQDASALTKAARGAMPLIISADRASDLMTILRLKQEYPRLDIIILGANEGWQVADALAAAKMKVIIDPLDNLPESFESLGARRDNVNLLQAAGVDFAIANLTSLGVTRSAALAQHAGNAVGAGLDWNAAFAAISSTPARWFGLEPALIKVGETPDIVLWDGDPLQVTSAPEKMWIDGTPQSLESRQTKLRDRYNPTSSDTRPHKYR